MFELRSMTLVVLAFAVLAALFLPVVALCHRWGIFSLPAAFNLLAVSVVIALLVLFASLYLGTVAWRGGRSPETMLACVALLLSAVELAYIGAQAYRAFTLPMIHDITTDGVDVPAFDVAHELRGPDDHPLDYGSELLPAADLWALQRTAYPDVRTIHTRLDERAAFDRALALVAEAGLEIVNEDRDAGRIEAVATTFWFGFKDDMVVRVKPADTGVEVDLRSVSRVGQSDLGANAARIRSFIEAFERG